MTTGIAPDGAGRALSFTSAWRAASRASSSTSTYSVVRRVEHLPPDRVPHRLEAGLHAGVAVGDHADAGEHAGDVVVARAARRSSRRARACGCRRSRPTPARPRRRPSAPPRRCAAASRPSPSCDRLGVLAHLVDDPPLGRGERHRALAATAARRGLGGRRRRRRQAGLGQVARVREAGGVALDHADAGAEVAARGHLLDAAVVEADRGAPFVLRVDLGELGSGAQGDARACVR